MTYRNPDGTLGVPGIPGHYTCEWTDSAGDEQCGEPARHEVIAYLVPEGIPIEFRYCDRHAPTSAGSAPARVASRARRGIADLVRAALRRGSRE